ncbi:hypothetical protein SNEBB_004868 [Seison nebaliae]|nr:hypothetical protein SNEBB_004868 [Seison nebaliae]
MSKDVKQLYLYGNGKQRMDSYALTSSKDYDCEEKRKWNRQFPLRHLKLDKTPNNNNNNNGDHNSKTFSCSPSSTSSSSVTTTTKLTMTPVNNRKKFFQTKNYLWNSNKKYLCHDDVHEDGEKRNSSFDFHKRRTSLEQDAKYTLAYNPYPSQDLNEKSSDDSSEREKRFDRVLNKVDTMNRKEKVAIELSEDVLNYLNRIDEWNDSNYSNVYTTDEDDRIGGEIEDEENDELDDDESDTSSVTSFDDDDDEEEEEEEEEEDIDNGKELNRNYDDDNNDYDNYENDMNYNNETTNQNMATLDQTVIKRLLTDNRQDGRSCRGRNICSLDSTYEIGRKNSNNSSENYHQQQHPYYLTELNEMVRCLYQRKNGLSNISSRNQMENKNEGTFLRNDEIDNIDDDDKDQRRHILKSHKQIHHFMNGSRETRDSQIDASSMMDNKEKKVNMSDNNVIGDEEMNECQTQIKQNPLVADDDDYDDDDHQRQYPKRYSSSDYDAYQLSISSINDWSMDNNLEESFISSTDNHNNNNNNKNESGRMTSHLKNKISDRSFKTKSQTENEEKLIHEIIQLKKKYQVKDMKSLRHLIAAFMSSSFNENMTNNDNQFHLNTISHDKNIIELMCKDNKENEGDSVRMTSWSEIKGKVLSISTSSSITSTSTSSENINIIPHSITTTTTTTTATNNKNVIMERSNGTERSHDSLFRRFQQQKQLKSTSKKFSINDIKQHQMKQLEKERDILLNMGQIIDISAFHSVSLSRNRADVRKCLGESGEENETIKKYRKLNRYISRLMDRSATTSKSTDKQENDNQNKIRMLQMNMKRCFTQPCNIGEKKQSAKEDFFICLPKKYFQKRMAEMRRDRQRKGEDERKKRHCNSRLCMLRRCHSNDCYYDKKRYNYRRITNDHSINSNHCSMILKLNLFTHHLSWERFDSLQRYHTSISSIAEAQYYCITKLMNKKLKISLKKQSEFHGYSIDNQQMKMNKFDRYHHRLPSSRSTLSDKILSMKKRNNPPGTRDISDLMRRYTNNLSISSDGDVIQPPKAPWSFANMHSRTTNELTTNQITLTKVTSSSSSKSIATTTTTSKNNNDNRSSDINNGDSGVCLVSSDTSSNVNDTSSQLIDKTYANAKCVIAKITEAVDNILLLQSSKKNGNIHNFDNVKDFIRKMLNDRFTPNFAMLFECEMKINEKTLKQFQVWNLIDELVSLSKTVDNKSPHHQTLLYMRVGRRWATAAVSNYTARFQMFILYLINAGYLIIWLQFVVEQPKILEMFYEKNSLLMEVADLKVKNMKDKYPIKLFDELLGKLSSLNCLKQSFDDLPLPIQKNRITHTTIQPSSSTTTTTGKSNLREQSNRFNRPKTITNTAPLPTKTSNVKVETSVTSTTTSSNGTKRFGYTSNTLTFSRKQSQQTSSTQNSLKSSLASTATTISRHSNRTNENDSKKSSERTKLTGKKNEKKPTNRPSRIKTPKANISSNSSFQCKSPKKVLLPFTTIAQSPTKVTTPTNILKSSNKKDQNSGTIKPSTIPTTVTTSIISTNHLNHGNNNTVTHWTTNLGKALKATLFGGHSSSDCRQQPIPSNDVSHRITSGLTQVTSKKRSGLSMERYS